MKTKFVCALVCLCFALASVLPIASVAWAEGAVDYSLKFYDDKVTKLVGEAETELTSKELRQMGIEKTPPYWEVNDFVFETTACPALIFATKNKLVFFESNATIKTSGSFEGILQFESDSAKRIGLGDEATLTLANATESHALVFDYQARTCDDDGWECWCCTTHLHNGAYTEFFNEKFELVTDDSELVLPAWHHNDQTHAVATAPTCTSGGNVEYYRCNKCYKYLKKVGENAWEVIEYATDENGNRIPVLDENGQPVTDYNGNQVFADYSPFLPAKGHNMVDGVCTVCGYTPPVEQQNSNWWVWLLVALGSLVGLAAIAYGVGAILYKRDVIKGEFFAKIYPFVNKWY